jgi:hypothetical protein
MALRLAAHRDAAGGPCPSRFEEGRVPRVQAVVTEDPIGIGRDRLEREISGDDTVGQVGLLQRLAVDDDLPVDSFDLLVREADDPLDEHLHVGSGRAGRGVEDDDVAAPEVPEPGGGGQDIVRSERRGHPVGLVAIRVVVAPAGQLGSRHAPDRFGNPRAAAGDDDQQHGGDPARGSGVVAESAPHVPGTLPGVSGKAPGSGKVGPLSQEGAVVRRRLLQGLDLGPIGSEEPAAADRLEDVRPVVEDLKAFDNIPTENGPAPRRSNLESRPCDSPVEAIGDVDERGPGEVAGHISMVAPAAIRGEQRRPAW